MTGYTPIYNLPYPQASDLVSAYPGTGQDLAEEVETVLAAKAPLASPTFTGNVVWSGATLRTATANIATNQSTSSSTFTDLATVGPTVTITTGTKALVIISCWMANTQSSYQNYASFAVSGATTIAASDTRSSYFGGSNSPYQARAGFASVFLITSLTAGSNTFTMKYRAEAGGTSNFVDRNISVIDLGS